MKYVGYHEPETLPVMAGDTVTITKGVEIWSMHPKKSKWKAGRTYKIKVHHVLCGSDGGGPYSRTNPQVRWPGSGGYWNAVDINDIPEAQ